MNSLATSIRQCQRCNLRKTCQLPVPGDGNFSARILVIGEAPGANEDRENKPFVGRSGKLLSSLLESFGFLRERDYYITNIVKCRPPENRDPLPEEISACSPWLVEQLDAMNVSVILALGRFSFSFLVPGYTITDARGKAFRIHAIAGKPLKKSVLVLASFHPAVALYNPSKKEVLLQDLALLPSLINKS